MEKKERNVSECCGERKKNIKNKTEKNNEPVLDPVDRAVSGWRSS